VSTKSSAVAGLLQLFFGWFGIGRFYVGSGTSIALGAIQLVLGLFGLLTFFFFFVGLIILIPLSIWTFIDAIVLFTGSARDSEGRRLR
jgi:TM2 domain-containing membrane protein YozV